jgi:DnaJ-class molecular chaperone
MKTTKKNEWRCFHCGEVFRKTAHAAEHFGIHEGAAATSEVEIAYRIHRMRAHPDRGGSTEAFNEVERAWQQFREERGLK